METEKVGKKAETSMIQFLTQVAQRLVTDSNNWPGPTNQASVISSLSAGLKPSRRMRFFLDQLKEIVKNNRLTNSRAQCQGARAPPPPP